MYNKEKECINHIESILKSFSDFNKLKAINFSRCNKKIFLIKEQAAAILSHEILGHIFEIDNYNLFKYYKYLNNISKLNLTIKDIPSIKMGFGIMSMMILELKDKISLYLIKVILQGIL